LFDWKALKRELSQNPIWSKTAEERYRSLKQMAKKVEKNKALEQDKAAISMYRYLTGIGYQYIERTFYDPD
jgi:hypothetical protein